MSGGLAFRSAEVLPTHRNVLVYSVVVATHRVYEHLCCDLVERSGMLSQSVAVKVLCLLQLCALGDTSALRAPKV